MKRFPLLLLLWGICGPVLADPVANFESAWSARQVFSSVGTEAGVAAWTSTSGWTEPGIWLGAGAGLDGSVNADGSFGSLRPALQGRFGVQWDLGGWVLVTPWAGGSFGWSWGPEGAGVGGNLDGGLDAEMRLAGNHFVALGAGYRSDGAVEVSLAFRDRTTWRLPPPPPKPRYVTGRLMKASTAAPKTPTLPVPPPVSAFDFVVTPEAFSPDNDGSGDELRLDIRSDPGVAAWRWTVIAPGNQVFYRKEARGPLPAVLTWDGLSTSGELVSSAIDYLLELQVTDTDGRTYSRKKTITTDVLLLKVGDQYLIRLPSINFVANSPGLAAPSAKTPATGPLVVTLQDQNTEVLGRLAEILKRFPQYRITIVGHANLVSWADPSKAAEEDKKESRPLSLQRAQSVKDALVKRGLDPKRIKVEGAGGSKPLFPFGDQSNAWKNRRVDVVLDKTPTGR